MPLEPAETRPRSNFPDSRVAFQGTISYAKHRRNVFMAGTEYFGGNAVQPRDHIPVNTMGKSHNHTFGALIRLSTTTQNVSVNSTCAQPPRACRRI